MPMYQITIRRRVTAGQVGILTFDHEAKSPVEIIDSYDVDVRKGRLLRVIDQVAGNAVAFPATELIDIAIETKPDQDPAKEA